MLLDKQYYNPDDPRPYDDVGWTVGPFFNTKTVRIEDVAVLEAEMTLVESVMAPGGVEGRRGGTYLVNYNADNTLAAFRFANEDLVIHAAQEVVFRWRPRLQPGHLRDPARRTTWE